MIRFFKRLFVRKGFVSWERYKAWVDFVDVFDWQQSVRRDNVKCKEEEK